MGVRKFPFVLLFILIMLIIINGCANGIGKQAESAEPTTDGSAATAALSPALTPEQIVPETAVSQPATPYAAAAEILGLVMADSDAGNVPDSPLENQLLLIMTLETAGRLFGAGSNLRFTQKEVPLDDPHIKTVTTDADGTFSAAVIPAEIVLCLADELSEGIATTRGCGQFTAIAGPNTLTISVGFGEILLESG